MQSGNLISSQGSGISHGDQAPERRRDGCSECRRKKVKCDLRLPVCSRCTRYPRECKYESRIVMVSSLQISEARRASQRRRIAVKGSDKQNEPGMLDMTIVSTQAASVPTLSTYLSSVQFKLYTQTVVSETMSLVFPLAPRSFIDRLLSSAMETPHLLYALLATSDSHNARRRASMQSDQTTLKFTNNAIAGLRTDLADARNVHKIEMAVTAVALCTNDVCGGNLDFFRVHLAGVRGMLSGLLSSDNRGDPLAIYLFKWFAALDVSAGLSLFHRSSVIDPLYTSRETVFSSSQGYVDDICGYSLDLLPILAEIGNLARIRYDRLQNTSTITGGNDPQVSEDVDFTSRASMMEIHITSLPHPKIPASILDGYDTELADELRHTHTAFVHTALLHLHRRVHLLPKGHPRVLQDVRNILQVVSGIRPSSTVNILLLWPIFSAGCETDIFAERVVIDERMSIMQSLGMGNFTRARNILKTFWDSGTDLGWDVYLAQSGVDLVLF